MICIPKERKYDIRGVSIIKNSMIELNKIILDSLLKNKLNPYSLPPTDFMSGNKPISNKIKEVEKICKIRLNSSHIWRCIMVWSK